MGGPYFRIPSRFFKFPSGLLTPGVCAPRKTCGGYANMPSKMGSEVTLTGETTSVRNLSHRQARCLQEDSRSFNPKFQNIAHYSLWNTSVLMKRLESKSAAILAITALLILALSPGDYSPPSTSSTSIGSYSAPVRSRSGYSSASASSAA